MMADKASMVMARNMSVFSFMRLENAAVALRIGGAALRMIGWALRNCVRKCKYGHGRTQYQADAITWRAEIHSTGPRLGSLGDARPTQLYFE